MARPRTELHQMLKDILGTANVYFQPPESLKLKFPCIVYERRGVHKDHADDIGYRVLKNYQITYMDEDPDSVIPDKLLELPRCSFDRHFTADNLNHDTFTIYF